MALYFQTDINRNDIFMNDRVYFSYPEAEDGMGGPEIIREIRNHSRKIPIRVRSSFINLGEKYGSNYTGLWNDVHQEEKLIIFREDLDKLKSYLDRNALVCFFITQWTDVLYEMERKAPKLMDTISEDAGRIFDMYPPKDIRTL